jgi:hypothetical protein
MTIKLPFIFIFDIDNCLIGNVDSVFSEHTILNYMRKNCKINKITDKCLFNINFEEELEKGLLRPFANDFIEFAKHKYKPLELYLYTNSTYTWANDGLIPNIQKKINHTINLPIFTRENSIRDGGKSLSNVYEIIIDNLVNKYPALKDESNIKEVFENRLVFIDDIEFNLKDFPNKQIKCPEYNYEPPYANIKDTFKKKYNIDEKLFDNIDIYRFCSSKEIPIYSINGVNINQKDKLLYNLLENYYIRESELEQAINKDKPDTFFRDLIKKMKNINELNEKNIKKINDKFKKT